MVKKMLANYDYEYSLLATILLEFSLTTHEFCCNQEHTASVKGDVSHENLGSHGPWIQDE